MGNIWKRLLSLTLAMVMVLGMVPVQAFATDTAADAATVSQETEAAEATVTEAAENSVAEESSEAAPETTAAPADAVPETTAAPTDPVPETTQAPAQATEPEKDTVVESVQALIDALPVAVGAQEEAEALNGALIAVSDAIAELTTEQAQQLKLDNYYAAAAALEQWYAQDYSTDVLEDLVDCYWDGDTLYIKDGHAIDLYNALLKKTGISSLKGMRYGTSEITWKNYSYTGTAISSGSSVSLNQQEYYYCVQKSFASYDDGSFRVAYYYDLTAQVADGSPEGGCVSLSANRVTAGDVVAITVAEVAGYTATVTDAKGNVIHDLSAYAPTESTTLTVTYVSNEAEKYTVTLETVGGDYGTAELKTDSSLTAGAEALISAEAREKTDNTYYYVKSVEADGEALTVNSNGDYTYTMGSADVTITVTFGKYELTANTPDDGETIEVKFNGYADATVDKQLKKAREYFADVEKELYLEDAILNALDVTLNDTEIQAKDVEIQYLPWYKGSISDSWTQGNPTALNGTPDDKLLQTAYAFGTSGRNEKVVITYNLGDGTTLSVTREIRLTEGRKALPSDSITTSSETVSQEAIQAAAAKAVTFVSLSAEDFTLEENWESKLVSGQSVEIGAAAEFGGNAEYVGGTIAVGVSVTKVSEPAAIVVTEAGGIGVHTIPGTYYAGTVEFTVTPAGNGAYVESVTVNDAEVTLTYKNAVASGSFAVENNQKYDVTITYGKEELTVAKDAEVALNLYVANYVDYSARMEGLKGKLLTALLGESVIENDYEVYFYQTGLTDYATGYVTIDSVTYKNQIENDIKVKIVKKASDNGQIPAVTVEDIPVKVVESRQDPTIVLNATTFAANTLDDLKNQIKNVVVVTDSEDNDVTASAGVSVTLAEGAPALTKETQTYTVTVEVTKDGRTWRKTETTATIQATLAKYTITWDAGDGAFTVDSKAEKTVQTQQYYGEVVAAPESNPAKEQTVSHSYTFEGWENLAEDTTVSGDVTFAAKYKEDARVYTITWNAGDGVFADGKKEKTTEVAYGGMPALQEEPSAAEKSFAGWTPECESVTGEAAYTAQYTDDVIYKVTFVYGNGVEDKTVRVNATKKETIPAEADPERDAYVFTAWECNVEGVEFGETPTCEQKEITFTAQWERDTNKNGVADKLETLTVTILGEGQVTINGTLLEKAEDSDKVSYVFDSLNAAQLTITAAPVVADKLSQTYVVSITNVGEVTYGENYAATAGFVPENGKEITVTFADAGFQLKDERVLDYYPGMEGVTSGNVYDAIVETPAWKDDAEITVEYLARKGGETVYIDIDNLTFSDNDFFDSGIKAALKLVYTDGKIPVEQSETWVALGDTLKVEDYDNVRSYEELINDILQEELKNFDWKDPTTAIQNLIKKVQDSAKYYGAHEFGENASTTNDTTEEIRLTYADGTRKIQTRTDITLHDSRIATRIVGSDMTLVYRDFKDTDLPGKVTVQTVDGTAVSGAAVTLARESLGLEGKAVSETTYAVTFRYAGNETYKPSEATFQVTITKATASMDIANVVTTYGSGYTMNHNIICNNAYGDAKEIENSLIKFVVGLDVADVTVDENGLKGISSVVQLILPEDLKAGLGELTGNWFENGVEMSLSDLVKALELIDADSLGVLKQALEAISNIAGAGDITIKLGGKLPTDIGTYLYGAVSTTGNYETVLDVAYIIIQPNAQKVYLDWNHNDTNGIFTAELLQYVDLGASAFDDAEFALRNDAASDKVRNLFFGVNKGEDNKPALVLKLYDAKINPENFETDLGNGGFTQMAFIVDFGNELHYAVPIVRAFAIVPNTVNVRISDGENTNFRRTYDGEKQELTITVNGEVPESGLEVRYVGVTTKAETYNATTAPVDAGAYVVTAIYRAYDENGKLTGIGMDMKSLLVLPAETETTVDDAVVTVGETVKLEDIIHVTAAGNPDMTILTAQLATDGSFSEIGMDAISGNVNLDFPQWVDDILADKAPEIYQGVTVGQLSDILNGKIKTALESLDLGAELTKSLTDILDQLNETLNKLPLDATVTFNDTDETVFSQVGVYLVGAVVTDGNYRVSADYGLVVVKPDVQQVYLDWNYHDNNGIWTEDLLREVDLYASAYTDPEFLYKDAEATKLITHTFLTVDSNGDVKVYHKAEELRHGAYLELAYIELDVDGTMTLSDLIARPIVTVPNTVKVEFVDENDVRNHDRKFTYDGKPHAMNVRVVKNDIPVHVQEGELTVTYRGVTTAGETYVSETAPVDAGAYTVTAVYAKYDGQRLIDCGAAVGAMVIQPAAAMFTVTGGIIPWDGNAHGVTVVPEDVDYTLISATAAVGKDLTEVGMEAVSANLNVDFPAWVDAILEEQHPDAYKNGIDAETLIEKLKALQTQGTWTDKLVELLEKVPSDMNVTFESNLTFVDPGVYVFAGFLTDFNYVPASDAALLVIQKKDSGLKFTDTTVYYDGNGQSVDVTCTEETDYVTVIVDRENNIANILFEDDLTAVKNLLEKALGRTLPEKINVTELMAAINKAIDDVAAWENLPADVKRALEQLKALVNTLPQTGTIYIDGDWLPVDVGEYAFYGISLSPVYQTECLSATLTIQPAQINITVADQAIYYGETEPEAAAKVTAVHGKANLAVTVTRDPGTDAGKYPYHVSYTTSKNYTVMETVGALTIRPAEITVQVMDAQKTQGEADPDNTPIVTVENPKDAALDTSILNIRFSRKKGEEVGEYPYSVTYTKNANFDVTVKAGKLTIKTKDAGDTDNGKDDEDKTGKYPITFNPKDQADTIKPGAIVEIDGKSYVLDKDCTVWVDHQTAKIAQTFAYHAGEDAHHTYPTHMYVWYLTFVDGDKAHYDAQAIPELTDFFQYHGTSIRVNFASNGIRFVSSVSDRDANALIQGSLIRTKVMEGYKMTQAGTLFKWGTTSATALVKGEAASSLVYGVKGENSFRVFQKVNGRNWFTGMLTNLGADKQTLEKDLVSRPYAVLERNGETITIYGGTIQRNIYYVAKQNENWMAGTAYNDYIKGIIRAVEKP